MTNYAVGANIPGYLPEGDVWITDDWEAARGSLRDDLERHADAIASVMSEGESSELLTEIDTAIDDLDNAAPGSEWYAVVPTSDSQHDLGLAFWLTETEEDPEGED